MKFGVYNNEYINTFQNVDKTGYLIVSLILESFKLGTCSLRACDNLNKFPEIFCQN